MGRFSRDVDAFIKKVHQRYRAVARTAVQDTVAIAQRTEGEGGRMRVDTGFLRASIQGALGVTPPSGPVRPPKGTGKGEYVGRLVAGEPLSVTLLKWDPLKGQQITVGWTANYARHREYQDGFLRGAVEQWSTTVRKAVVKVEAGFG
jgi:hypothetical protein